VEPDNRVVSSDDEQLILVDSDDREIGFLAKADAHLGRGTLHRAFLLFVFNPAGELLLQQRAKGKRLWSRLNKELFKVPAVCKVGRIIVAHATIDLIPGKDGAGADGAVVTFVGDGAPWRGTAWRAALAPINLVRRIWQLRPSR
jgi:hypothetical protein